MDDNSAGQFRDRNRRAIRNGKQGLLKPDERPRNFQELLNSEPDSK
jgi:hypothetical protein